jgi:hypothetical protein
LFELRTLIFIEHISFGPLEKPAELSGFIVVFATSGALQNMPFDSVALFIIGFSILCFNAKTVDLEAIDFYFVFIGFHKLV